MINTPLLRRTFGGGSGLPDHSETLHYLATSPDIADVSGQFFANKRIAQPSPIARDDNGRFRLWQLSEKMVGEIFT